MVQDFIARAKNDLPIYIGEVREKFSQMGTLSFHCHVHLYDESIRCFDLKLPEFQSGEEEDFVETYVYASIYNILSALGAMEIYVYVDTKHEPSVVLAKKLDTVFQLNKSKDERYGYGKCLNVNERTLHALCGAEKTFCFTIQDLADEPCVSEVISMLCEETVFSKLPQVAADKILLGMDIGGTDIKLVAAVKGKLIVFKEFDWFPAAFERAEQLIDPILQLVHMMMLATTLHIIGKSKYIDEKAFQKDASQEDMSRGILAMEKLVGDQLIKFDAIGLCFPDVVIDNRIVGGETYKTRGMRNNTKIDYEMQFKKITDLSDLLCAFVTEDGVVCNTNDGPMAAFTTAVEQAAAGTDVSKGFFAHTLGTELGTGWVLPDGSIPKIPLEMYNFIIDLGSYVQKQYEADDVRSVNNFNTGLAGTLQKFACQSGVFRLAAKFLPKQSPKIYADLLANGLFLEDEGKIIVPTEPQDMRKPCLEYFMAKVSAENQESCQEIFLKIGESLGACWQETQYILAPEATDRTLYGRLVKNACCFKLLFEGAKRITPKLVLYAADGNLANTKLMKQLADHPDYTVAQFAQAVGAIFYGCVGLIK